MVYKGGFQAFKCLIVSVLISFVIGFFSGYYIKGHKGFHKVAERDPSFFNTFINFLRSLLRGFCAFFVQLCGIASLQIIEVASNFDKKQQTVYPKVQIQRICLVFKTFLN